MIRWCIITQGNIDEELMVCNNKNEAIDIAKNKWKRWTTQEQKHNRIFVGVANVDENGCYVELDNGIIDANIREFAWENGKTI